MDADTRIELAASSIKAVAADIVRLGMKKVAFVSLDGNEASRQVVNDWIIEKNNLKSLPFTVDPACLEDDNRRFSPIVFPLRWGPIKVPNKSTSKYVVLIALEDLSVENGLLLSERGPHALKKGDWICFKRDEELTLGTKGGGTAIWLELDEIPSS